jgi:hypothetical protein
MLLTSTGRRKRKARILLPLVGEGSLAKRGRMRDVRAGCNKHHHIAGPYLKADSREIALREDHLRASNGEQYLMITPGRTGASCVAPPRHLSGD